MSLHSWLPQPLPPESAFEPFVGSALPPFFFAGPTRTLVAQDEGTPITGTLRHREDLLDQVERALRTSPTDTSGCVLGAVPFGQDTPVCLFRPERLLQSGPWSVATNTTAPVTPPPSTKAAQSSTLTRDVSEEERGFMNAVSGAVDAIGQGALRKVVLARAKDVCLPEAPNVARLLRDLRAKNPHGFTFAVSLPRAPGMPGEGSRTLVGASPELLLSRRGALVVSAPLAGSVPRSPDAAEDEQRAARLLRSAKDRHEHRFVVEQILEGLRPFTTALRFEREPTVTATHSMWHLSTRISGTLRDLGVSSLRLALALHPTPAVCGTPTKQAAAWIAAAEPFDRGYFTGTLGHMDAAGDGDWIVTIRCAEVGPSGVRVFAGAGIVEHSVPALELEETNAKMQTMLAALGVGGES